MRMRNLIALMSIFSAAPVAVAADLPGRGGALSPAPMFVQNAPFSWSGFYAGLNAGYGWGSYSKAANTIMGKQSGGELGVQVGYNYQYGNLVLGVEGDVNGSWLSGSRNPLVGVATRGSLDWYGTLRGRAGFAADRALIYVTGGYAGGEVKSNIVSVAPAFVETTSGWRNGYALGAGIEYAFTNSISAKAEYMYMNLGSQTLFLANLPAPSSYSASIIRAGVNYHF